MAQVKFKYGLFDNLNKKTADGSALNVPISDGTIYVTTDTHSMFIDLGNERFRIGDFERYKDLKDLVTNEKNWYEGSLALIETTDTDKNNANQTPILAYYNGSAWININDTTTLQATLQGNIDKVAGDLTTLTGTVSGNSASIAAIKTDIGTRPDGIATTITIWQAISNLIGGDGEGDLSLASLQAAIEKNAEDIGTNAGNISTNAENISKEVQRASTAESALGNRLTNIENDLANNTANYATVTQVSTAKEEAISSANEYTDAQISAAKGEVNEYTDTKVAAEKSRASGVETALGNRLDTLEGVGTGSVREIARTVLVEQLIPENAADALDTLQEIAAWIQSHPGDAAAMNLYISNLEEIAASFIYEKDNSGNFVTENGNLKRLDTVTQDAIKSYIDTRVTAVDNKLNWETF